MHRLGAQGRQPGKGCAAVGGRTVLCGQQLSPGLQREQAQLPPVPWLQEAPREQPLEAYLLPLLTFLKVLPCKGFINVLSAPC